MGWPATTRNITLANGSCSGTLQFADNSTIFTIDGARPMTYFGGLWRSVAISISGMLGITGVGGLFDFPLSLLSTKNSIGLDFKVRAVPASGTQEIYRGDIYSKKKLLGLINVTTHFVKCRINSNTGMLALDNAPGGVYDIEQFGIDESIIMSQLPAFFQGYVVAQVLESRFCFIPTASSLALTNPESVYRSAVCNTIACNNPAGVQNFFAPTVNELHISYTQAAANWIIEQQDPSGSCNEICANDLAISGDNNFCTTSTAYSILNLPAGSIVTWSATPSGTVGFSCNPCNSVVLTKNYDAKLNLTATITNACGGGPFVVTRNNIVAGFPFFIGPTGADTAWPNSNYYYYAHLPLGYPPVSDYYWEVPSGWTILSGQGTNALYVRTGTTGGAVEVDVTACGITRPAYKYVEIGSGSWWPDGEAGDVYMRQNTILSPNPADNFVTISMGNHNSIKTGKEANTFFSSVTIYDITGAVRKRLQYKAGTRQARVNTSDLRPGTYIVEVSDGRQVERQQLIIQK